MTGVVPFIIRRTIAGFFVVVVVTAFTFALGRYAPGDPVTVRAGPKASQETIDRVKRQYHLDQPVFEQYGRYMWNLLHGDLGDSFRHPGVKVSELVFPKVKVSLQENIYPFFLTFGLALPLGIYLALKRGTWIDPTITANMLILSAIPVVLVIPVLQVTFAVKLHWLPVGGWHGIFSTAVILPTIVLTYGGVVGIARLMRISLIQVMEEEYVRTARAKGLSERVVIVRHLLRNACLPIVTAIIYSLFGLVSGSFFVEYLFGIPGIAAEAVTSIGSRDYDEFMAITLLFAVLFVVSNMVLDIVYSIIDPRIRIGGT